jgi:AcrR family transcriptional regulator
VNASARTRRPQAGDQSWTPAARPGRPRSEQVERAVFAAVDLLMAQGMGPANLTVERIAATAGVGKSTIYRRWAGKEALLADAIPRVTDLLPPRDGATDVLGGTGIRDGLVLMAEVLRAHPRLVTWLWLFGAGPEMRRDAPLGLEAAFDERVAAPLRVVIGSLVGEGMAVGRFRSGLDQDFVSELLLGWLVMSVVYWRGTSSSGSVRGPGDVLDAVLDGLLDPPASIHGAPRDADSASDRAAVRSPV